MLASWVVTVNDFVQKRTVGGALSFFKDATGVVIFISTLEANAAIRAR